MLNLTRHFHKFSKSSILLTMFIVAVCLLGGIAIPAFADSPQVNGTIISGSLSETALANYSFTGTPGSTITYPVPFTVSDLTGSAAGWGLSITSTTLTGSAGTLPTNASTITGTTATCTTSGTCTSDSLTNGTLGNVLVPANTTAPSSTRFFSAAAGASAGTFTVTPTISVVLPGRLVAGTLASTVTLTISSGP